MSNLEKSESIDLVDETLKGVSSERSELTSEERKRFSSPSGSILRLIYAAENADSTYLIFNSSKLHSSIKLDANVKNDLNILLQGRVLELNQTIPEGQDVVHFAQVVLEEIEKLSLKRITLIGIEDGASIAQALSILEPRLFRRAVLINPRSRVHPTFFSRLIDNIEKFLPVGLPFRAMTTDFDSRPFLHRIRCPVMVLQASEENFYDASESLYIARKIPNCYLVTCKAAPYNGESFSEEFLNLLAEFQQSPAKRPQKNR